MNYIHRLEADINDLRHQVITQAERVQELREHLASSKFNHDAQDGSRTDWISTADVQRWLQYITSPVESGVSQ